MKEQAENGMYWAMHLFNHVLAAPGRLTGSKKHVMYARTF